MFRWGRQFRRSSNTKSKAEALAVKARVEDTIRFLRQGRISIPDGAESGVWIMSEGKVSTKPGAKESSLTRVGEICEAYLVGQIDKADTTLASEKVRIRHIRRLFGETAVMGTLTLNDLQEYVNNRLKEKYRGASISGKTIRKEVGQFREIWDWGRERGYVNTKCPIYGRSSSKWAVAVPKPKERERFQTWAQIKRQISRGGLTKRQQKELWMSLFLDDKQVAELLNHVKDSALHRFIHPMFMLTAYTGARRGEVCRSRVDDFDFETGLVKLRERKRRKDMAETFRFVPIHLRLREVMQEWFANHPGGQYTIVAPLEMPRRKRRKTFQELNPAEARHHFNYTLAGSEWQVIRGFHVLRHSFGSNLARSGKVPRDTIAEWMGHTTEEMKALYQHLFPQDGQSQIDVLK
ncbi:MAG: tyrosine-type recombinase/integrase [Candidatus Nealsonbacteria bacterium]|nr:tyrosine-type recombinase/integrase [Candidatus Nealsonbacteria bacterium]